jgi:hypothetical protein
MPILTHKCPHCSTEHMGLRVVASSNYDSTHWIAHLHCPKCLGPSAAKLYQTMGASGVDTVMRSQGEVTSFGWGLDEFWPAAPGPRIPEYLPQDVERIYLQAERNFLVTGNEEASGTMYRKALDVALTHAAPSVTGTLAARIKKLVEDKVLTVSLGEWATQIRLLGNESAHEADQPTREELEALRNFSDLLLRYLITLPAMVLARTGPR